MEENIKLEYKDGLFLDGYKWTPEGEVKALVVMFHGMAEHAARYSWFGNELAKHGYKGYCFSYIGHGHSSLYDNKLGYLPADDYITEINNNQIFIINKVKEENPNLPLFIFAHSMGSMSSQRLIQTYPDSFDKVILCGTDIGGGKYKLLKGLVGHYVKKEGKDSINNTINKLSMGSFDKKYKKERPTLGWLSKNPENIEKYIADPLCGYPYAVGYYYSLANALNAAALDENIKKIQGKKVLLICGEGDPVANFGKAPKALYKKYNKLGVDVSLVIIPEARHEILNEESELRDKAFSEILKFYNE